MQACFSIGNSLELHKVESKHALNLFVDFGVTFILKHVLRCFPCLNVNDVFVRKEKKSSSQETKCTIAMSKFKLTCSLNYICS